MLRKQLKFLLLIMKKIAALIFISLSLVHTPSNATNLSFTGTLFRNPPCDVYGIEGSEQPIKVVFDDIGITRINGENYRKDFSVTVSCGAKLGNGIALYLGYKGTPSTFDKQALMATPKELGIRLFSSEGKIVEPNSKIPITLSSNGLITKTFTAVPVKDNDPSLVLAEGPFKATATVEITYP